MANKFFKTASMAGMFFLATTALSFADSTVGGTVTNHLESGQTMVNAIGGDRNEAFIASVKLKDSHVDGKVTNEVGVVDTAFNFVIGDDNKATIAGVKLDDSRVGGEVTNNVPSVDGTAFPPVLNYVRGDGNNASIASIDIAAGSNVGGTVANQVDTPVTQSGNIVFGDRNTAAVRSIHLENADVSGKMTNTTENVTKSYNIIGFGPGFPGNDNTALLGSISAKNTEVSGEVNNHVEHMEETVNLVIGDGNESAIGSMSFE